VVNPEIRSVTPTHPDVAHLLVQLGAHNLELHGSTDLDHSFPETWLTALVAYDGIEPVGLLGIRPLDETTVHLVRLFVTGRARGQGVTQRLAREAFEVAKRADYLVATWDTGTDTPAVIAASAEFHAHLIAPYGTHRQDPRVRCFSLSL
jgi:GNAT superfamily N-acetyltransferase